MQLAFFNSENYIISLCDGAAKKLRRVRVTVKSDCLQVTDISSKVSVWLLPKASELECKKLLRHKRGECICMVYLLQQFKTDCWFSQE